MPGDKNVFGDNLRIAKATHVLSYTDFAKQLNTTESTITFYQNRDDNKFIEFLFLLRKAGVDMNKLFTDTGIKTSKKIKKPKDSIDKTQEL